VESAVEERRRKSVVESTVEERRRKSAVESTVEERRRKRPWKAPWKSGASAPRKPSINEPGFSPRAYWGAGLCERPEDWQWSSFRHYAPGREGRVEIESEWTARKRERAVGILCPALELPHSSQNQA